MRDSKDAAKKILVEVTEKHIDAAIDDASAFPIIIQFLGEHCWDSVTPEYDSVINSVVKKYEEFNWRHIWVDNFSLVFYPAPKLMTG